MSQPRADPLLSELLNAIATLAICIQGDECRGAFLSFGYVNALYMKIHETGRTTEGVGFFIYDHLGKDRASFLTESWPDMRHRVEVWYRKNKRAVTKWPKKIA